MAHYAFLDENNVVTNVIVGVDENEILEGKDPETWYSEFTGQACKRTSYNAKIRKNFAGIGYTYDEAIDAFVPPKPFPSWILDTEKAWWISPAGPYPEDGPTYDWNEETLSWDLATSSESSSESEA